MAPGQRVRFAIDVNSHRMDTNRYSAVLLRFIAMVVYNIRVARQARNSGGRVPRCIDLQSRIRT